MNPEGNMNILTKCHSSLFNCYEDISLKTTNLNFTMELEEKLQTQCGLSSGNHDSLYTV